MNNVRMMTEGTTLRIVLFTFSTREKSSVNFLYPTLRFYDVYHLVNIYF